MKHLLTTDISFLKKKIILLFNINFEIEVIKKYRKYQIVYLIINQFNLKYITFFAFN
jgi:hypothetical protein